MAFSTKDIRKETKKLRLKNQWARVSQTAKSGGVHHAQQLIWQKPERS